MKLDFKNLKKPIAAVQLFLILVWASKLSGTDSLFSAYALCCILSVLCLADNLRNDRHHRSLPLVINLTIASLLSFAVTLANYPIFQYFRKDCSAGTNAILNLIAAGATFFGGIIVFYHLFLYAFHAFPMTCKDERIIPSGKYPVRIFFLSFIPLASIYLIYLFFVVYPGSVTSDALWQIDQTYYGNYSVHHPFWHTMCIKLWMSLGYSLFQNV